MAIPILIKRSSVPGKVPTTDALESGELALNIADGKLFYKTTDGLMSAIDKKKLDGVAEGAEKNVATNLGLRTLTATDIPLTSSIGTGVTLPSATATDAGIMSAADKAKLNGVESGAQKNVDTDLSLGTLTEDYV